MGGLRPLSVMGRRSGLRTGWKRVCLSDFSSRPSYYRIDKGPRPVYNPPISTAMKGSSPTHLIAAGTAVAALLLTACGGGYYYDHPPYYHPQYSPQYPHGGYHGHGGHPQGADPSKIENPDWDAGRQYGRNPAQNHRNQAPGGGQTQPAPGGAAPTPAPGPSGPPNGILVPNRPGMIMSPYAQDANKLIDVRGLPSGTVIECPYSDGGRTIRVP